MCLVDDLRTRWSRAVDTHAQSLRQLLHILEAVSVRPPFALKCLKLRISELANQPALLWIIYNVLRCLLEEKWNGLQECRQHELWILRFCAISTGNKKEMASGMPATQFVLFWEDVSVMRVISFQQMNTRVCDCTTTNELLKASKLICVVYAFVWYELATKINVVQKRWFTQLATNNRNAGNLVFVAFTLYDIYWREEWVGFENTDKRNWQQKAEKPGTHSVTVSPGMKNERDSEVSAFRSVKPLYLCDAHLATKTNRLQNCWQPSTYLQYL